MYNEFSPSQFSKTGEVVLIPWNNAEGVRRLERSKFKGDFYRLAHYFQPQINPLYCGIATSVIILNALRAEKNAIPSQKKMEVKTPKVWGGKKILFPSYSQLTFLNAETDKVKPRDIINLDNVKHEEDLSEKDFDPGLSLEELKQILEQYGLKVKINHASQKSKAGIKTFGKAVTTTLNDANTFIIANFKGSRIGGKTNGHISPLAAYDENSDSVLILDVAGHKNSWYWAPLEHLYRAMMPDEQGVCRGWLIVSNA